ncbi:MAG: hypothetical protein RR797_03530 [Christensenella sp.]
MKSKAKLGFAKSLSYNVLAIVIMNVVIQFAVYPYLNKVLGETAFGSVLYLMSIVAILAGAFGVAVSNTRLVIKTKMESKNGDYSTILLIMSIISIVVVLCVLYAQNMLNFFSGFMLSSLVIMTLLRYYSDVEYRLSLRYKWYFFFYMLISAGYLIGVAVYRFTQNWYLVFIVGEALAVLFVIIKGEIYKKPFECSTNRKIVWRMIMTVAISYLISDTFQNLDRIVLQNFLGGDAVTTFYTASLLGKTIALLVGPLNGVMIAYLVNYKGEFNAKIFSKAVLFAVGLAVVGFVGCILVSPWLIQLLYPNVYAAASGLIGIASLGMVVFFSSALLLAIVLRFCHEKYQFLIQLIYGGCYLIAAIPATINYGIYGFAYATLFASLLRFVIVVFVGYKNANKHKHLGEVGGEVK